MKKVKIACALFLCMLCSCSIQNNDAVENNQNITISNSSDAPELTRNNNEITNDKTNTIIETSETLLETPIYALYDYNVTELCTALVDKNKDIIDQYMFFSDGNIQFIDNINFESYKILSGKDSCLYEEYGRKDIFSEYLVSFYISSSNDERFPVGESEWKICFTGGLNVFCYYFIPYNSDIDSYIYKQYIKNNDNIMENISYAYSLIFNCYQDIDDFSMLSEHFNETELYYNVESFLSKMYDCQKNKLNENALITFLGSGFELRENNINSKLFESSLFYIVDEIGYDYIEITYYADCSYFTPAKKLRYNFNIDENNVFNLSNVKLVDDYGYEPACVFYGDM